MSANHLFIGIGGTGGKVLKSLRKRVYEEFGSNDPDKSKVCIEYLYIDSSEKDLNDDSDWRVLGKTVKLTNAQKVSIHGIQGDVLDNLSLYPGIQSFMPEDEVKVIRTGIPSIIEDGIGGQRRRLGRMLFANNMANVNTQKDFVTLLKATAERLTNKSNEGMITFHICAGLAGGTGSGSIVDIISQIRKIFTPVNGGLQYKIFLYLYLPEMIVVNSSHDQGYYQANGYAALSELNAISIHKYLPKDVSGQKDPFTGEVQTLLDNVDPFDAAFVYSNINEKGKKLELSSELPTSVADFIFQQAISSAMLGTNGQMGRLVNCENQGTGPELDLSGTPTRSRKFISFGIKRIEYPENEIKEYATYKFAYQAVRQLFYNKWDGSQGFIEVDEDEIGVGYVSEIKDIKNREKLKLSNEYLMLQKPFFETKDSQKWKDFDSTWERATQHFADDVMESSEKQKWLSEFNDNCEDYYANLFRTQGVKKFFSIQRQELTSYAKLIRRHIEGLLFEEWAAGKKSIFEISKYISLLIKDCSERIDTFNNKTSRLDSEKITSVDRIKNISAAWSGIRWTLDPISHSSKKIFNDYKAEKRNYYSLATRIEGYSYAKDLLQAVITELGNAKKGIDNFKQDLSKILEEAKKQADSRCQEHSNNNDGANTIKKYKPEDVQFLVKGYVTNEEMQCENALQIRNAIISRLGEAGERTFSNLHNNVNYDDCINIILDNSLSKVQIAMEESAKKDNSFKMLNVNILEKLKEELSDEEKLEKFVKDLLEASGCFIQFNEAEMSKASQSTIGGTMQMVQLCIPEYNDPTGFREKFIHAFQMTYPGFSVSQDVCTNYKSNQIVVVSARAGLPLRMLANLSVMKEKYNQLLANSGKELNRLLLHTETSALSLPSLYELDSKELKSIVTRPVLLAYAMKLITPAEDPVTQEKFDAVEIQTKEQELLGIVNRVRVGKNVLDTIEYLSKNYDKAKVLMDKQKTLLEKDYRSNDSKNALKVELGKVLAMIKACPECENNDFNPTYKLYQTIILDIFNKELANM